MHQQEKPLTHQTTSSIVSTGTLHEGTTKVCIFYFKKFQAFLLRSVSFFLFQSFSEYFLHEKQSTARSQAKIPEIVTTLKDVQVEEGSKVELSAKVESEPEPVLS